MENSKKRYQSKTILSAIVNVLATLFLILDIEIEAMEIERGIALLVELLSIVWVFYWRIKAKTWILLPNQES